MTIAADGAVRRARAGRRGGARQPAGGARGAGDHHPHVRAREPRPPSRRWLRHVRSDALSGRAHGRRGDRTRGAGDGGPRAACATGSPASVFYTASCGGRTETAVERLARRGGSAVSAVARRRCLRGRAGVDGGDSTSAISCARCARAGFRGDRLRGVRIASRNASGRVARLTLEGLRPDRISGQDLRVVVGRTLGWQHIKSTAFDLRRRGRCVSVQRPRLRPRRRHVRDRRRRAWPSAASAPRPSSPATFPGCLSRAGGQTGVRTGVRHPSDPTCAIGRTPV